MRPFNRIDFDRYLNEEKGTPYAQYRFANGIHVYVVAQLGLTVPEELPLSNAIPKILSWAVLIKGSSEKYQNLTPDQVEEKLIELERRIP